MIAEKRCCFMVESSSYITFCSSNSRNFEIFAHSYVKMALVLPLYVALQLSHCHSSTVLEHGKAGISSLNLRRLLDLHSLSDSFPRYDTSVIKSILFTVTSSYGTLSKNSLMHLSMKLRE